MGTMAFIVYTGLMFKNIICPPTWLLVRTRYLSCLFDALPDAEVGDDPGQGQAPDQIPPQATDIVDPVWYTQGAPPEMQNDEGNEW